MAASEFPRSAWALTVAYYQGLRRKELANLRWSAVDLDRSILHVVNNREAGELTKSRKNRSLPMHPEAARPWPSGTKSLPKVVNAVEPVSRDGHVFTFPDGSRLTKH